MVLSISATTRSPNTAATFRRLNCDRNTPESSWRHKWIILGPKGCNTTMPGNQSMHIQYTDQSVAGSNIVRQF